MSKTKETFNCYSVVLEITSDHNFFYAKSSNGFDFYGVLLTDEGCAICSCPAGSAGLNCKHRKSVLARFPFVTPDEDIIDNATWAAIKARIEIEADKDAYRTMIENEAA